MPAFCVSSSKLYLSKPNRKLYFLVHYVGFFNSQIRYYKTHDLKFGLNESKLLKLISQHRLNEARSLLDEMPKRTSHGRFVYWTSLLTRYSKCGFIDEAETLFGIMSERNVTSYNAMLSGYIGSGRLSDAMRLFEVMPEKNVVSWTAMFSGLADSGRIVEAKRLFEEMPVKNVVSWNVMVSLLIRNGDLGDARRVFDGMAVKNTFSWNMMIAGYVENGQMEEARVLFEEMRDKNVITWTTMISGYCRVGKVEEGYHLFQRSPEKNVVSWTAMIGGFCWNGFYIEALHLFLEMKSISEVTPNVETFISLTYACAGLGLLHLGKQLHAHLIINGLSYDVIDGRLSKSLIYMYSLFGSMDSADYLFSKNSNVYTVQCSNYMISACIRIGQLAKAQVLFDTIQIKDKVTWTTMIDGYFKAGNLSRASILFYNMPDKDVVAWTVMISGHVQNELFSEATYFFSEMRALGVSPLSTAFAILFGAAGAMSYLEYGMQLHSLAIKSCSDSDLILYNSLISMYAKCGDIHDAHRIFSNMNFHDLISWNSMIMGFSHHGLADEALKVFKAMLESGTCPNSVTFLGVLSACAHAGLVGQGQVLFKMMSDVFATLPGLEHCISMISLLGRADKVKEAEEFILGLPFEGNQAIWGALLGVCGHDEKNVDIAKRATRRLLELDPLNASAHVLLCNIYAAAGQHEEEHKLRKEMGLKGIRKTPGCSWILVNGSVHTFLSGDKLMPHVEEMLLLFFNSDDGGMKNIKDWNSGVAVVLQ